MAEHNEEVLEQVKEIRRREPDTPSRDLYEMAQRMDPAVGEMSLRQFHARYVLTAGRALKKDGAGETSRPARKAASSGRAKGKRTSERRPPRPRKEADDGGGGRREEIRAVFVQFARDFS
ncbi:MAG: hypothetical protein M3409_01570, partial [Gemmatimonadota bacterium]|nr:hypothetical protein [Gemmatimonadota bacterium]